MLDFAKFLQIDILDDDILFAQSPSISLDLLVWIIASPNYRKENMQQTGNPKNSQFDQRISPPYYIFSFFLDEMLLFDAFSF
jgi:hypothetical protein